MAALPSQLGSLDILEVYVNFEGSTISVCVATCAFCGEGDVRGLSPRYRRGTPSRGLASIVAADHVLLANFGDRHGHGDRSRGGEGSSVARGARYPVDIKTTWLRGSALKDARKTIDRL